MVYLDHNASVPMSASVIEAMTEAARQGGNPSSVHDYGRRVRARIEAARKDVATMVGAAASQVIFTSGATEANAMGLRTCGRDRVFVSATEHVSVLDAHPGAATIPVDADGVVQPSAVRAALTADGVDADAAIVSVMLANNETGVIQPISEIAAVARELGALMHCDAVQAPGRLPVDMAALGIDLMTVSAHKVGGPAGVGALILRDASLLRPDTKGGGQEKGLRGGTENITGIAGFGAAAKFAVASEGTDKTAGRRDRIEARVTQEIPDAVVFGSGALRLPNTSCIAIPGIGAETQVMALDLAGYAVSAGSACSSGKVKTSHVLLAMGVDDEVARCAIRISLGPDTSDADVDGFIAAWTDLIHRLRRSAA